MRNSNWTLLSALVGFACFSCVSKLLPHKELNYNTEPNRQFWSAEWSHDGKLIAIGGVDSMLRIFHAKDFSLFRSYPIADWIHCVDWHPESNLLAVATLNRYTLLVDVQTGSITSLSHTGGSRAVDWNQDGNLLAVADLDGEIRLWSTEGRLVRRIAPALNSDVGTSYLAIDWHPFKNMFVASHRQLEIFDTSGRALFSIQNPNPQALMLCAEWHPSGEFFVVGDYGRNWEGENVPSLLNFWSADGEMIRQVHGSEMEYRNLAWDPKGELLATASDVLRIWNKDGSLLFESPKDSTNYLWGVGWSPDGKQIVTVSRYKTVALWNKKAELLRRIEVPE